MRKNTKSDIIIAAILTLLMTFMEMTALPMALFCDIRFKDIEPIFFSLMLNFLLAFIICGACRKFLLREWRFGLHSEGIAEGLREYGLPALAATVAVAVSFCIGLSPLDNIPTVWRVLIEGILYYVGVGIMEELYLRGLLQNIIEILFGKKKNGTLYAVLIASVLFGAGHIFGAAGQPVLTIICKAIWAAGLGVYFGAVYAKTSNLWIPIILHTLIDLCGIPVCFSDTSIYPDIALVTSLVSFVLLGVYGAVILRNEKQKDESSDNNSSDKFNSKWENEMTEENKNRTSAARREDWKTEAMPEQHETFVLSRSFSDEEMTALRHGNIPQAMEDKWFWYMEGSTLWAHRSWTGHCIYRIDFKEDNNHIVTVNRDPEQYKCTSIDEDIESLNKLLDWWTRTPYDHYNEWLAETYDALEKSGKE